MSVPFQPEYGLIIVPVSLAGPKVSGSIRCALDTGSTDTLISTVVLELLGYDVASTANFVDVTTASGSQLAPQVAIQGIRALGFDRKDFTILGLTLPPTAGVDGLLGLDFLRGLSPNVDFRRHDFARLSVGRHVAHGEFDVAQRK